VQVFNDTIGQTADENCGDVVELLRGHIGDKVSSIPPLYEIPSQHLFLQPVILNYFLTYHK
jgi:hypothetical protein